MQKITFFTYMSRKVNFVSLDFNYELCKEHSNKSVKSVNGLVYRLATFHNKP